ncbi:hypothetical protein [Oceanobacter kriegii]|uniref:hypothetical protein n=1 Tax=Oceanobacter kriegii TaxID=64972 RepID=UPI0012EC58DB|nr:hypothetical protein [Oceanobacter kriegii]
MANQKKHTASDWHRFKLGVTARLVHPLTLLGVAGAGYLVNPVSLRKPKAAGQSSSNSNTESAPCQQHSPDSEQKTKQDDANEPSVLWGFIKGVAAHHVKLKAERLIQQALADWKDNRNTEHSEAAQYANSEENAERSQTEHNQPERNQTERH